MLYQPREHHYLFAHQAVPWLAQTASGRQFFALWEREGTERAISLWEKVGMGLSPEERLEPIGLGVTAFNYDGIPMLGVTMPKAERMTEAHFILLARPTRLWPMRTRVFVLERSFDAPFLCEWDRQGRVNYGAAATLDMNCMAEAVAEIVRLRRWPGLLLRLWTQPSSTRIVPLSSS
ncbi:MAG TPA: hypothetical protein VLL52_24265 [Anaerolineae bacterium]|nr:hypothetical protein [Anaerolineae bacterium]